MSSITKHDLLAVLSEITGLDKKSVDSVLVGLAQIIKHELGPQGQGEITIPGIVKLRAKATPARATRMGVNPFTKQPAVFHSKPAGFKVRSTPLKNIKDVFQR